MFTGDSLSTSTLAAASYTGFILNVAIVTTVTTVNEKSQNQPLVLSKDDDVVEQVRFPGYGVPGNHRRRRNHRQRFACLAFTNGVSVFHEPHDPRRCRRPYRRYGTR